MKEHRLRTVLYVRPRGRQFFFILQTNLSLPFVSCTSHSFFIMVQSCVAGLSCQHFACLLCDAIRIYIALTVVIALLFTLSQYLLISSASQEQYFT